MIHGCNKVSAVCRRQSGPFQQMAAVAQRQRAAGVVGQLLRVVDSQMVQQSRTNIIGIERPIDGILGLVC